MTRHGRRPRTLIAALVATSTAGLVLAAGAPLWWWSQDGPASVTAIRPGALHRLAAGEVPERASAVPSPTGPPRDRMPAVPVSPVGGDLAAPARNSARPTWIGIPSLSVRSTVRSVGVADDGQLAIPADIRQVGWFRWGSAPGDPSGSVVLVGHLDSATQPGLGALAYLRTVEAGATIRVRMSDGRVWTYRVVARQEIAKAGLPLREIFAHMGRPRLVLMTCGGSFDPATRSYDDTIVVAAVPRR